VSAALLNCISSFVLFQCYLAHSSHFSDSNCVGEPLDAVYSWFKWEPEEKWNAPDTYRGVEESLAFLKQQFVEYGPFDGVLGFSQEGIVTSVLAGMRVPREQSLACNVSAENPISFDFAIFAATFAPPLPEYFYYTMASNKCAPLATLHVYGSADPLVPADMSKNLAAEFETQAKTPPTQNDESPATNTKKIHKTTVMHLEHPGGHFVATNAASKAVYKTFIEAYLADFPK